MGGSDAGLGLLLDAITSLQTFVRVFIGVYTLLIFGYVIAAWIRPSYAMNPVHRFLHDVCDPYLRLFRRILPPLGPLDLSPVVAIVVLWLVERLVNQVILDRLH